MERTARPWRLGKVPLNYVRATSQPLGFPAPLASRSSESRRDRPCTQAVYPQLLRDSTLVQMAFVPAPASKCRSGPYSNSMPPPNAHPCPLRGSPSLVEMRLRNGRQLVGGVESPAGEIPCCALPSGLQVCFRCSV